MTRLVLPLTAVAVCWAFFLFLVPAPAIGQVVPADVQQAALAGDWNQVWTILGAEKTNPEPAELRLIKGHACLALNYNNQSLELFASALNDADRQAWQTWADTFAQEHQDNAIAWYFQGDAHARLKEWVSPEKDLEEAKQSPGATECFDEAIRLDPNCYLALNARGVVAHAVGNTLTARAYFLKATKAKESFADAYASRGILNLGNLGSGRGDGPEESFKKAVEFSRDGEKNAVALSGLGCVRFGKKDDTEAQRYFDAIPADSRLSLVAARNLLLMAMRRLAKTADEAEDAGMSVRVRVAGQPNPVIPPRFPWESGASVPISPDLLRRIDGRPIESIHRSEERERPTWVHERDCTIQVIPPDGPMPEPPDNTMTLPNTMALRGGLETVRLQSLDLTRLAAGMTARLAVRREDVQKQQQAWIAAGKPGGATTGGIRTVASRWDARTVYGLLYDVVGQASSEETRAK